MEKYQNKYRIKSARLEGYDYGRAGLYFITICTGNREHYFGEIHNGKMQLSNVGVLADVFWCEIKNHTKNVELHEFVVMPNHVHGVLEILDNDGGDGRGVACNATIATITANNREKNQQMSKISPKSGTVGRIIGSYKGAVTKHANRLGYEFGWQSRFHDHIIRNRQSFDRIQKYIINNPQKWTDDKFHKDND